MIKLRVAFELIVGFFSDWKQVVLTDINLVGFLVEFFVRVVGTIF